MSGHRRSSWQRVVLGAIAGLFALVAQGREPQADATRSDIVVEALSLLGTPYRYGGNSPDLGFDCSGLVRHVFAAVLQRDLPRRAEEISGVGQPIARTELQPGDLVFFNTLKRAFSHVAIYIGDGRFVHAPARSGRVRIEGMDDRYWAARFNGARRVIPAQVTDAGALSLPSPAASAPAAPFDRPPGP